MTPLLSDLIRDEAATRAQRLALLVEMTAWHFGQAQDRKQVRGAAPVLLAEWHLGQAARLAREVAEREWRRCAAADRDADHPGAHGGAETGTAP